MASDFTFFKWKPMRSGQPVLIFVSEVGIRRNLVDGAHQALPGDKQLPGFDCHEFQELDLSGPVTVLIGSFHSRGRTGLIFHF